MISTQSKYPTFLYDTVEVENGLCHFLGTAIELQVNWNDNSGGKIEASVIQFL